MPTAWPCCRIALRWIFLVWYLFNSMVQFVEINFLFWSNIIYQSQLLFSVGQVLRSYKINMKWSFEISRATMNIVLTHKHCSKTPLRFFSKDIIFTECFVMVLHRTIRYEPHAVRFASNPVKLLFFSPIVLHVEEQ